MRTAHAAGLALDKSLEKLHILFVEDDKTAQTVYSRWMAESGATVTTAASVAACLHCLQKAQAEMAGTVFDLLLLDYVLPDGSIDPILDWWSKHATQKPAVVFTAMDDTETFNALRKKGCADIIRKPINRVELSSQLQRQRQIHLLNREHSHLVDTVRILSRAHEIAASLDKSNVLQTWGRVMHRETQAEESFVFLFQPSRKHIECLFDIRIPGAPRTTPEVIHTSILDRFIANRSVTLDHLGKIDPKKFIDPAFTRLGGKDLLVELQSPTGNAAFLVLLRTRYEVERLDQWDLKPLVMQAGRAFHASDVAAALSFVDELTGLYNQRFLLEALNKEVALANRYGHPVSLIFFDLDKFKAINDSHGHVVGSQIIKEAARIMRQSVRDSDLVLRYGGDEFVSILPSTPLMGAAALAERVRVCFEKSYFDVREQTGVETAYNLNVTTSVGISCVPETSVDVRELIQTADDAMYTSKRNGKNRITLAPLLKAK